jgi:hypothetical protein
MPGKKKAARPRRTARPRRRAGSRLEKTWSETRSALSSAEATVGRRVKALVDRSGVDTRRAARVLDAWRVRLDRERRRALRQVESRLAVLQTRARKEQRALGRTVDDAVQRTLAALNIPSRQEVQQLTRRVEELSRKVGRFRG